MMMMMMILPKQYLQSEWIKSTCLQRALRVFVDAHKKDEGQRAKQSVFAFVCL